MAQLFKKVYLLFFLMFITLCLGNLQTVYAQSFPIEDSLRKLLTWFHQNVKDEKLKQEIKEAQFAYSGNNKSDFLISKLLTVDSILVNSLQPDSQRIFSYTKILTIFLQQLTLQEEHPYYTQSVSYLANFYQNMGQYEKALSLYEQIIAAKRKTKGEEHPDYAMSLHYLGTLYKEMGKYEKALTIYEQVAAIRKKTLGEEHQEYANIINFLALLYQEMGQFDKAMHLFEKSKTIRKKVLGEDHFEYAQSLNNLASLYYSLGQYERALPFFEQAVVIFKKTLGEGHPDYVMTLNNLAFLYGTIGLYKKALPVNEQVIIILKKTLGEKHPDYALSLNCLASLYVEMGLYEKALPLYEQVLAIRKKALGNEHPKYALSLNNLAVLFQLLGQYEKALLFYEKAEAIKRKTLGVEHPEHAVSLNNIAKLYKEIGRYEKALPLTEQAMAHFKKTAGKEHPDYAVSLNNTAELYRILGWYEKALPLYEQATDIFKKALGIEHPNFASSLNNLAILYKDMSHYEKAMPLFEQAINIRKKSLGEQHPIYAISLIDQASLYYNMGQYELALPLLRSACIFTLKHLAQTYTTLSEQEKILLLSKEANRFNTLPSLLYTWGNHPSAVLQQVYANELALKGMVLEDQKTVLSCIRKSGDTTALQLYEQWSFLKMSLGKQLLLPQAKRVPYFDSLQETATHLEQGLSRRSVAFRELQQRQSLTAKVIAQKLSKGQAAVEFIRFPIQRKKATDSTMYAALVVLPLDTAVHFIPLFEEKQLKRLLQSTASKVNPMASIRQLYPGTMPNAISSKDSLYHLIWKPLEQYFQGAKIIFYAPAGLLHRVAFQALKNDSAQLLIDKYQLNQVLSTRSVALPETITEKPVTAAIWGDIEYNLQRNTTAKSAARNGGTLTTKSTSPWSSFNSESGSSLLKIDSLKETFTSNGVNISVSNGSVATEERFKLLDGKSPQLLHIATHGFFYPVAESKPKVLWEMSSTDNPFKVHQNPLLRSGLVLAGANHVWTGGKPIEGKEDGVLTAYDIARMDLSNTGLVVLSACQTALGDVQDNEGVIGLQRAFKLAGVKQVLVSLWEVPAKQTTELMLLFYKEWLKGGNSVREALRSAQLKMKEKYPPSDWAAFVVVE